MRTSILIAALALTSAFVTAAAEEPAAGPEVILEIACSWFGQRLITASVPRAEVAR